MRPICLASLSAMFGLMLISPSGFSAEQRVLTPKIINGSPVDISEYPFLVSIQEKFDGSFHHRCGGTFLSANKILTAAHCVVTEDGSLYKTEDLQVVSGITKQDQPPGEVTQIQDMKVHPKFKYAPYFDVAVITLANGVESFTPVSLASSGPKAKSDATVLGWGSIDDYGGTKSNDLLDGSVYVSSGAQCRRRLNKFGRKRADHYLVVFCATKKPSDICDGDSGGPLLTTIDGNVVQAGITGAILDPDYHCASNSGAAYTKVSAKQIKDFIQANR